MRGAFSEDELVTAIRRLLGGQAPGVVLGPGDDAALVEPGQHLGILTADLLIEGIHFRRETLSPHDLGYKALVANVSDVAAMGGSPRYALVSLGVPDDVTEAWVIEVYGGLRDGAQEHAVAIVGGDLSRSDRVVVSVALTGEVGRGAAVLRSGARPGDRVVVTGVLGAAAGGLRLTDAMTGTPAPEVTAAVGSDWAKRLVAALDRPAARVGEGQTLAQCGATAMMDLSDGLTLDLSRLCLESGVGAAVRLATVPVSPDLEELKALLGTDPLELALSGGEDYELLATLPADRVEESSAKLRERFGTALSEIGEIREGSGLVAVGGDESEAPLEPRGWDHFGR